MLDIVALCIGLRLAACLLDVSSHERAVFSFVRRYRCYLIGVIVSGSGAFLHALGRIERRDVNVVGLPVMRRSLLQLYVALIRSARRLIGTFIYFLLVLLRFRLVMLRY